MTDDPCVNRVYYFEVAPGRWHGEFGFEVTDWRAFLAADLSLLDHLLVVSMVLVGALPGRATITSEVEYDVREDRDHVDAELTCEWAVVTEAIARVG